MKNSILTTRACNINEFLSSITKSELVADYSANLSIYKNEDEPIPSAKHLFEGRIKLNVAKTIAAVSLVVVFFSSISAILSCLRD
jgi:hypothetical protein